MSELEQARAENNALRDQVAVLQQQLDWLKRQLFGRKSERVPEGQGDLRLVLEENVEDEKEAPHEPPSKRSGSSNEGKKRETRAQHSPDNLPVREEKISLLYAVERVARESEISSVLRQRERAVTSGMVLVRIKRA